MKCDEGTRTLTPKRLGHLLRFIWAFPPTLAGRKSYIEMMHTVSLWCTCIWYRLVNAKRFTWDHFYMSSCWHIIFTVMTWTDICRTKLQELNVGRRIHGVWISAKLNTFRIRSRCLGVGVKIERWKAARWPGVVFVRVCFFTWGARYILVINFLIMTRRAIIIIMNHAL